MKEWIISLAIALGGVAVLLGLAFAAVAYDWVRWVTFIIGLGIFFVSLAFLIKNMRQELRK